MSSRMTLRWCWRGRGRTTDLLLQRSSEVRHHGDGLADLLRNHVEKNFFAVGRDVIKTLLAGRTHSQGLAGAELPSAVRLRDRNREYRAMYDVEVVKLFPVLTPLRADSLVIRDLPFAT